MVGNILRTDNLHVKILIPVWGITYLEKFLYSYSTHVFSNQNIEILEKFKTYEIIFLTNEKLRSNLDVFFAGRNVNYKLIFIDDLLSCDKYGIVLTLAYTRAILNSSTQQQETAFIFLNADFIISNNTFDFILEKLNSGYNAILCPSMRCIEEDSLDLISISDRSSRSLVNICQNNMHHTMVANIVNQNAVHNSNNLAIHYAINSKELMTVSFNPFMLCIKPEVNLTSAIGFCDFSFMPMMVPSDNYYFVTDSDEMFILESAPYLQEKSFISFKDEAKPILEWMSLILMKNRLDYGKHIHCMHSQDIKSDLSSYKNLIKGTFNSIISSIPKNYFESYSKYDSHPFWIFSVKIAIENGTLDAKVPEIDMLDFEAKCQNADVVEQRRKQIITKINHKRFSKKMDLLTNKYIYTSTDTIVIADLLNTKSSTSNKPNSDSVLDVRVFLNTVNPMEFFSIDPNKQLLFDLSQSTFDFYRTRIFKFVENNSNAHNIIIKICYEHWCPLISVKYLFSIFQSIGLMVNIIAMKNTENFSTANLKWLLKHKFLPKWKKFIREDIYLPMFRVKTICPEVVVSKLKYSLGSTIKRFETYIIDHNVTIMQDKKYELIISFGALNKV